MPFASQTFAGLWAEAVSSHASLTFLVFEGSTGHVAEWTYGDFDHQVGRVGASCASTVLSRAARSTLR